MSGLGAELAYKSDGTQGREVFGVNGNRTSMQLLVKQRGIKHLVQ